jgi:hypothetical protein
MRPKGSPEELERRRQRAITLLNEGYQNVSYHVDHIGDSLNLSVGLPGNPSAGL